LNFERKLAMTETKTASAAGIAEQQKIAMALFGAALSTGAEPMLKAQADILASIQSTMTDWLDRCRAGVIDTQRLVDRLHGSTDPAEFREVQQEWASGVFDRLVADAAAYQCVTLQLMDLAGSWFSQGAENAASQVTTATRAAGKLARAAE
jgi:acetyl-CoA carboxylase carboxyltransferase component